MIKLKDILSDSVSSGYRKVKPKKLPTGWDKGPFGEPDDYANFGGSGFKKGKDWKFGPRGKETKIGQGIPAEVEQDKKETGYKRVTEVGEGLGYTYPFEKKFENSKTAVYEFETESLADYEVDFFKRVQGRQPQEDTVEIGFGTGDYDAVLNKGELYGVMSTVIAVVKDYIKNHPKLKTLLMVPSKAGQTDRRRLNLYLAYLKKQFPAANIKIETVKGKHTGKTTETIIVTLP